MRKIIGVISYTLIAHFCTSIAKIYTTICLATQQAVYMCLT